LHQTESPDSLGQQFRIHEGHKRRSDVTFADLSFHIQGAFDTISVCKIFDVHIAEPLCRVMRPFAAAAKPK